LWRIHRFTVGTKIGTSIAALFGALSFGGAPANADRPLIADLSWIHRDADPIVTLTRVPTECLVAPRDAERARHVRLGRVAFRSPRLLGGLAGRVGMSCNTCHRNGRDNPEFHIMGASGDPGTVDVTGAVFSSNRDDGKRNPVIIPTLVDAASTPPYGTIQPNADLKAFLRAVIVDEFQGEPPARSVIEGLLAYLQDLQSAGCPKSRSESVVFEGDRLEVLETMDVVIETLERGDIRSGHFALASLRAVLERVHQRFPGHVTRREELVVLSRSLLRLRQRLDGENVAETISMLASERARLNAVLQELESQVDVSFYDPIVLRSALGSR
jgi:hypothetical protein